MAQLIKTVDKTTVNFQDTFIYTINVGFSGVVGDISDAKLTDFIPSYISYTLPQTSSLIKSIDVESGVNGDLITFNFGAITDLGISIAINLKCKFIIGTDNGTDFTNHCDLYINNNNTPEVSVDADKVTLEVAEDFVVEKGIAVPTNQTSSPGGRVLYTIILRNRLKSQGGNGDPGAKINNIVISDVLPNGLTLDSNFSVIGYDISDSGYADTRYNGHTGQVTGNSILFSMDDYYGIKYRIVIVCNVNQDVDNPSEIYNTASLEISNVSRNSSTSTLSIGDPTYVQYLNKHGANYAQVGNYISYDISTGNYGNQDNLNFLIEEDIPNEITPYRIKTGSFSIDIIHALINEEYTITYFVNNSETPILLQTCNLNTSQYITLPTLAQGDKITKIVWNIPNMPVGAITTDNIVIDGIITSTNQNNLITNTVYGTWISNTGVETIQSSENTIINEKSELRISKGRIGTNSDVVPKQIIRYYTTFKGNVSQVNNPVVSDLLPDKLEYVGNEIYTFYDYFNGTTINSTQSNFFDIVPIQKTIINNYNSTGKTLVRYTMNDFYVRQKGWLKIEFDTRVKVGAYGQIVNNATLGNVGDNGIVETGQRIYVDIDDRDNDNITQENIAMSNDYTTNISYYAALAADKKVKGSLDTDYTEEPDIGLTYPGGSADYKLLITNDGNLNYEYIEIVDILPHIGDTGVIMVDQLRLSDFPVYNERNIVARVLENNIEIEGVNLKIEYSKSYNPKRFAITNFGNDTIGDVDDWSTILPNPITDLKSLKISTINLTLLPGQSIEVDISCLVPPNTEPTKIAWNSFAIKASYRDENNVLKNMIPVEPEKVGVQVQASTKGSIGGYAWIDTNENGNVDIGEVGKNGVVAKLYNSNKILISETLTIGDNNSNPGYYLFNNIDNGDYYVQFEQPSNMYFTMYTPDTQNRVNPITGKTSILSITNTNNRINNIDVGLVENLEIQILILALLNDIYNIDCSSEQSIIESINNFNNSFIYILNMIVDYCNLILNNSSITDYGYKTQIQRLKSIVNNIILLQNNIMMPNNVCNTTLISNLLVLMVDYLLLLLSIIEWIDGINVYYNSCKCLGNITYERLIGILVNGITKLGTIINPATNIISSLMISQSYTPTPYNPIYVNQNPIKIDVNPQNSMNFICSDKNKKN